MKILVAIDGSLQSEAAIEACAKFVKDVEQIEVVSVVERLYAIAAEPFAVSPELFMEVEKNEQEKAETRVAQAKTKLSGLLAGEKTEILAEVFTGSASQMIVEEAQRWKADLIVVGSHGYGFWQRTLLGSVSNSVVHHAPCSVLVVK